MKRVFKLLTKKDPMVFEVDLHLEKIITGKNQNLTNFDKLNIQKWLLVNFLTHFFAKPDTISESGFLE